MSFVTKTIFHNKGRSFLILLLNTISFLLFLTTVTNALSFHVQGEMVKKMFSSDLRTTYRIDISYIEDAENAGNKIAELKDSIRNYPETICAAYDESGEYFKELEQNTSYLELNKESYAGTFREQAPLIAEVVFIDPSILKITNFSLQQMDLEPVKKEGRLYLPIYLGSDFKNAIAVGDVLTLSRNNTQYIVKGYLESEKWLNDSDAITMPPVSLNHKFIAPFSEMDTTDTITQQSTAGKIFVSTGAKALNITEDINRQAMASGMKVRVTSISSFFKQWTLDNYKILKLNALFAGIIFVCSAISIISVLSVSVLLKKKEYGIRIAFGYTKKGIMKSIFTEMLVLQMIAAVLSFLIAYSSYNDPETSIFHFVYLSTLKTYSLVSLIFLILLFLIIIMIVPLYILSSYEPAMLLKEEE
jgi:ABC-type antimicrobial peptide transport system permease subunit